ncbi:MAG: restriction endonuclease [Christiangramia sp.]|nr:ATPase [Christiangramia sp.]
MRNANTSRYQIRKNSGELATFSAEKLRRSLLKSGAGVEVAENVLREVSRELYDGITTREIYRKAFNLLHGHGSHFACRYSLKKAIYEMGPSGFPFEKLVGYIFQKKNYNVQWNQVLQGRCVTHEVDLVLEKDRKTAFVECKFHSEEGRNCDVKVPLYIHSRFEDISQRSGAQKYSGWVVTNTRFTLDALEYGNCVGLSLLSWDYPKAKGLKDLADQFKIYPITVSSLLSAEEKQSLLEKGHVLASEILQHPELLQKEKISTERKERIIKELQKIMHHENGKN